MEVKKSDAEVKTKFLLIDILSRISRGETPYDIQKRYGWARQRLNYWVKKLKKAGLIVLKFRSTIAFYELTEEGKNFYTGYVKSLSSGIRLHNVVFKYQIIKEGEFDWQKEWKLRGLINRMRKESNATIVKSNQTLEIMVTSLIGESAYELFDKAKNIANNIAQKLQQEHEFELSSGELSRKPHFAVLNPVINEIAKQLQVSTKDGEIDQSEGAGEIDFFTPEKADNFLKMPERVNQLENHLVRQTEIMDKLADQIKLHLEVMGKISRGLDLLNDRLGELKHG